MRCIVFMISLVVSAAAFAPNSIFTGLSTSSKAIAFRSGPLLRFAGRTSLQMLVVVVNERKTIAPIFEEICEQTGITLSRYMMEVSRQNPDLRDLESLMGGIQQACKTIANIVDRAPITGTNPQDSARY